MNLDDVKELKEATEMDLRKLIAEKLKGFTLLSGLDVSGVDVQFVELREVGGRRSVYLDDVILKLVPPWE